MREGTHKRQAPLEDGRVLCNRRVWCWGRWRGEGEGEGEGGGVCFRIWGTFIQCVNAHH